MENRVLVWDLPTRLFHWLFAGAFLAAFVTANAIDDDSPRFAIHYLLGAVTALLVVVRIAWGFVGTRHARFSAFIFGPSAVLAYLRSALTGKAPRHTGHNPGSSVVVFLMLALALATAGTGALTPALGHAVKEVHEALALTMIGVVVVHLFGLALHAVRHRENIARSMIDGRKVGDPAQAIPSALPLAGVALLVLVALGTWGLVRGYDSRTASWTFLGRSISLQKDEGRHHHHDGE